MPKQDGKTNVLAISKNPLILESVTAAFGGEADFEIVDSAAVEAGIESAIAKQQVEIVLIDFGIHVLTSIRPFSPVL